MDKKYANSGVGFTGILTSIFIALKLTKYIDWSWWWVFSPIWIPWVMIVGFVLFGAMVIGLNEIFKD